MLDFDQLRIATAAAKRQFVLIREKYPNLKAGLVLSLPGGQTSIDSSPTEILSEFPAMIVTGSVKTNALNLLSRLKSEAVLNSETERAKDQLNLLVRQFKYDAACQIEIRFNELNYDLIWKLKTDALVDRHRTPKTKASIRIVLGRLAQFERSLP